MAKYRKQKRVTPARQAQKVTVYLEPTLLYRLRGVAEARGVSVAALCEQAVQQGVHPEGGGAPLLPQGAPGLPLIGQTAGQ